MSIRKWSSRLPLLLLLLTWIGCEDSTEPSRPAAIEIGGNDASGPAGVTLTTAPTFLVKDQHGDPFAGVSVTIAVASGGGTLASAPTQSAGGPTSVGIWTLGAKAGVNELILTVEGLDPVRITATGVPGAPAKLTAVTPLSAVGRVGAAVDPLPRATLTDAFDNPLAGVEVAVAVSGGTAPTRVTSGADGSVLIPQWVLGTVHGAQTLTLTAGTATVTFSVMARSGPPVSIAIAAGGSQSARAGTAVAQPLRVLVRDQFGNPADSVNVSFAVVEGGGSVSSSAATTDAQGIATSPAWTLGLRVVPQRLRATAGALTVDANASVATDYSIDVRFFGPTMSEGRRAAFTRAAQRLSAIVVADLPPVQATGTDLTSCGVTGTAPLNELIDDLVIFATVRPIDGDGKVLASAGPCFIRSGGGLPVIGIMQFDEADLALMESNGTFEGVITHEMLHVLGIGIGQYWGPLLTARGTSNVGFTGPAAMEACFEIIGSRCNVSVPVEDTGGPGTAESHWRESVFDNELMTGFVDRGGMPLSLMTIASLGDIGYGVNSSAADRFPGTIAAARIPRASPTAAATGWEAPITPRREITRSGRITEIQ